MIQIAPSLMCANFLNLQRDIRDLDRAKADFLHADVMDGHFVPNLALNFDILRQIRTISETPMDVHLMVSNPELYLEPLEHLHIEQASFHLEAARHPIRLARELRARGIRAGAAISPCAPLQGLEYVLADLDYVLVLMVEPGFAGQPFIPATLDKITGLKQMMAGRGLDLPIEVDGNINVEVGAKSIARGASVLVAGTSSVFQHGQDLYTACVEFRRQILASCGT
jgi:ribulose-phosphate 3-epimerase